MEVISLYATVLTVLGLVITIMSTAISENNSKKNKKRPVFVFGSTLLQKINHPSVTILFDNEQVENVYRLALLFWNAGSQAIRKDDFPSSGSPSVKFIGGDQILEVCIKDSSNTEIKFDTATEKTDLVRLDFEYLNRGDGALIEILYEAAEEKDKTPVQLRATLIDAEAEEKIYYKKLKSIGRFIPVGRGVLIMSLGVGMLDILAPYYYFQNPWAFWGIFGLGIFFTFFAFYDLVTQILNWAMYKIPRFAKPYFTSWS